MVLMKGFALVCSVLLIGQYNKSINNRFDFDFYWEYLTDILGNITNLYAKPYPRANWQYIPRKARKHIPLAGGSSEAHPAGGRPVGALQQTSAQGRVPEKCGLRVGIPPETGPVAQT